MSSANHLAILVFVSTCVYIQCSHLLHKELYPAVKPSSYIYSLTHTQFRDLLLSSYIPNDKPDSSNGDILKYTPDSDLPMKLDWREKGVVSPVKNQNACGGCWAFSVAECIESRGAIQQHAAVSNYSVQQIIDCDPYSNGCEGGNTCSALRWLYKNSIPLLPEVEYPLTDTTDKCKLSNVTSDGLLVTGYSCPSTISNETDLLSLLYNYGPLVAAVDATTWNEYMGGIIQYHCGNQLNHAVQIVGYDRTGDVPYYIVRNSWGSDWGHDGYVYIRIGADVCGITRGINVVKQVQENV